MFFKFCLKLKMGKDPVILTIKIFIWFVLFGSCTNYSYAIFNLFCLATYFYFTDKITYSTLEVLMEAFLKTLILG